MAERHLSADLQSAFPGRRTNKEVVLSLRDLGSQAREEDHFQTEAFNAIAELDDVLAGVDLFDEGIVTHTEPTSVGEIEPEENNRPISLSAELDKPRKRKTAITNPSNPFFPDIIPEQLSESNSGVDLTELTSGSDRLHACKTSEYSLVSLDSALGNSLTKKGVYKEIHPNGDTYFVYPAATVQRDTPPIKVIPKKDIDPFHRFKKLRKSIAVDMPDTDLSVGNSPVGGATNMAFSSEGDPESSQPASMRSSGCDSGNGQNEDGARNRKSYQEAMGRVASVEEHPKSGEYVRSFRPGDDDDDDMDLNPHCESDEDSLNIMNDTQGLMDVKSDAKEGMQERTKQWDVFRDPPRESGDGSRELCFAVARQLFKLFTFAFLLIAVLGLAMVSKGTLLIAASNIRHSEDFKLECRDYRENDNTFSKCVELPYNYKPTFSRHCLNAENRTGNLTPLGQPYERPMCTVMIVQWAWCLLLIVCTPYVFTFLRCLLRVCFKHKKPPKGRVLGTVLIIETLHAVGMGMFAFRVLPLLDNVIQGLMLMCAMAVVPSILKLLTRPPQTSRKFNVLHVVCDVFAMIAQVSALVTWPILSQTQNWKNGHSRDLAWSIPVSLFLISFRYWENYVDQHTRLGKLGPIVLRMAKDIKKSRTKIFLISSFWKICVTLLMMIAFLSMEVDVDDLFRFDPKDCANTTISYNQIPSLRLDWVFIWIVNMAAAFVCYFCARTAIKIQMQRFSFAIPLTLSTPFLLGLLMGGCEAWNDEPCTFAQGAVPGHIFYKCWPRGELNGVARDQQWWLLAVWWLSQLWLTWHIWWPKLERLVKTDQFFIIPLYDGVVLEQSLMYNLVRKVAIRKNARASLSYLAQPDQMPTYRDEDFYQDESHTEKLLRIKDETPLIYICATMWHENELEMVQMLKSIGRLDIDQCARRNAQDHLGVIDPDYYEFEAHIFFDDAMEGHGLDEYEYKVNSFVKLLLDTVDMGISAVHESLIKVPPPVKYPTPYGGRLEWTLPGGNKLVAHLKDKMKIRHKKRWSQVMYMYYFLGHRLWADDLNFRRKEMRAENTFLLALDGDVDFEPLAMTLLVDLMKRSDRVGAACGRIHPIGSGPMVWYQKFEYALGHWMQKATEHVLGCVLCSPGCFSLFRGSALMDDNVMKKYTTMPTEASHYIQYDQGEDRWLCTLLLQQGYRVEYCAASDSWTFAPESFNEFYNQRRRWMPSTMANIMDLLMSWRTTIKINENISMLYIIYQAAIFVFSLVGPGTIFLMIVGALSVALNGAISMWASFFINLIPVAIFIILCYTTKPDTQLWFASILTAIYALIQMLVLVGIIIQIADQGPCSPTAVFFFYVAGVFVLSALLHPQELFCLFHGFIYFLSIPSMYLLLMIYSLCNLNVISWGTREVKQTKTEKENEEVKQIMQEHKKKQSAKSEALSGILNMIKGQKHEEGTSCAWGACCRCLCCPKEKLVPEDLKFQAILKKLELMESNISEIKQDVDDISSKDERNHKVSITSTDRYPGHKPHNISFSQSVEVMPDSLAEIEIPEEERNELINPLWIEDANLGTGPLGKLSQKEILFFEDLIAKYLFPLEKDKAQEERVAMELNDLKNKMSFGFLLANGIFVVVMFTLQMNVTKLAIPWPCGENLQIEPLGFFFLCFFGLIMLLQTIGMVTHRMSTFLHIVATTPLTWFRGRKDKRDDVQNAIELARNLAALKEDDSASVASTAFSDDEDGEGGKTVKRSKTMRKIQKAKQREGNKSKSMNQQFTRRMEKLAHQLEYEDITAEEIEKKVLGRKNSFGIARRKSVSAIKYLQSRREKEPRSRGWSTSTVAKPKDRPSLNMSKSLDDQRMTSSLGRVEGGRMSIVNEDGESTFYEDVGNFKLNRPVSPIKSKPPPPLKPNLKKQLKLSEIVIQDEDGRGSTSQDQSSF